MAVLTFLGTAGDAYTAGRSLRRSGGLVVELAGNQFHLDPGPGAVLSAKECGVDLRRTVSLLVSSNLLLCSHDVNAVLSAMTYGGLDPHGVVLAPASVTDGSSARLGSLEASYAEKVVTLSDSTPRVGINDVDISVVSSACEDELGVGFILADSRVRIGYTGFTGFSEEVAKQFSGVDVLVACVSSTDDSSDEWLLSPSEVVSFAQLAGPRLLVLTGFSQQLLKRGVRELSREVTQALDCSVIAATDGRHVDVQMYI